MSCRHRVSVAPRLRGERRVWLAWALSALLAATANAQTPPPTPVPSPTAPAPVPLAEIATRSDTLAAYLKQLTERLGPDPSVAAIDEQLPLLTDRIRLLRARTSTAIAASPGLREVDDLIEQWRGFHDTLSGWSTALTNQVSALEQERGGLDELHAIWRATLDSAQAAGAPAPIIGRIKHNFTLIQQTRTQVESARETLLVLQDRVVQETAKCREAIDQLTEYRSTAVGRLFVRDGQPVWAPDRWTNIWEQAIAPLRADLVETTRVLPEYLRLQAPRIPFQFALFVLLLILRRRARQRTARWLEEDHSLAPVAAVFERPIASALFITLLVTPLLYPQLPILLRQAVRIAATPPLLRVLDRLVDRPILPGLYVLGAFFIVDQLRAVLAPESLIEQLLFLLEMLTGIVVLVWLLRSGRIERLRAHRSPRVVALLERMARILIVLLAFAFLAGTLGFLQLANVVAGTVLGSGYAAMLLFAMHRLVLGVWSYLLRTPTARGLRIVQHYRSLLEARGERLLTWIATVLWVIAVLASSRLIDPTRDLVREALTAKLTIGSFSISLGNIVAFFFTIWLSFLLSRFIRFVLEDDVYPRLHLPRGLPYALSTVLHYSLLLVGFLAALAAAGFELDRFALLAGAFGVGIGFGLQNVVNNFVSGLILLFERPIQVGDTVDIGQLSGEIRRIGIRSSTLRTGAGAEVILPNAMLIADPVTNWTLTDRMRRIDIAVGVAYGTDPEQVVTLLRNAAAAHAMVVEAPAPVAVAVGFGAAVVNFELRAWTDRFEQWETIRSELAVAINKSFVEAGIGIPALPRRALAQAAGEKKDAT
jgi:potassium-dependent mechanosensitive channel